MLGAGKAVRGGQVSADAGRWAWGTGGSRRGAGFLLEGGRGGYLHRGKW